MLAGTPWRPRSCTRPARRTATTSLAGRPASWAALAAMAATPRECPAKKVERRSLKSATASRASSSCSSVRRACSPGSPSIMVVQPGPAGGASSTSGAARQNSSTITGSNCRPRRSRAVSTAASTPSARWNTSAMSAKWNSRTDRAISSPPTPPGTPLPSHRVKTCCNGSRTSVPRPSRSAIVPVVRQCDIKTRSTARPPVAIRVALRRRRWRGGLPAPTWRSMKPSSGRPARSTW